MITFDSFLFFKTRISFFLHRLLKTMTVKEFFGKLLQFVNCKSFDILITMTYINICVMKVKIPLDLVLTSLRYQNRNMLYSEINWPLATCNKVCICFVLLQDHWSSCFRLSRETIKRQSKAHTMDGLRIPHIRCE